jgi:hypothetical protein
LEKLSSIIISSYQLSSNIEINMGDQRLAFPVRETSRKASGWWSALDSKSHVAAHQAGKGQSTLTFPYISRKIPSKAAVLV